MGYLSKQSGKIEFCSQMGCLLSDFRSSVILVMTHDCVSIKGALGIAGAGKE